MRGSHTTLAVNLKELKRSCLDSQQHFTCYIRLFQRNHHRLGAQPQKREEIEIQESLQDDQTQRLKRDLEVYALDPETGARW